MSPNPKAVLGALGALALGTTTTMAQNCGGLRQAPCADGTCTFVPYPGGRSAPNGNNKCVECGTGGKPACLGVFLVPLACRLSHWHSGLHWPRWSCLLAHRNGRLLAVLCPQSHPKYRINVMQSIAETAFAMFRGISCTSLDLKHGRLHECTLLKTYYAVW